MPPSPDSRAEQVVQVLLGEGDPEHLSLPFPLSDDELAAAIVGADMAQAKAEDADARGKWIEDYAIRDHGSMCSDYFQGAGTSHTNYDEVYVGTGMTAHEALEDAKGQAEGDGWNADRVGNQFPEVTEDTVQNAVIASNGRDAVTDENGDVDTGDCYWYVTLYIKGMET